MQACEYGMMICIHRECLMVHYKHAAPLGCLAKTLSFCGYILVLEHVSKMSLKLFPYFASQ